MIPQRNISLISNTLQSAGGRRIPESIIERDYVLAWLLTGLAGHRLRDVLAFKGGTALRRCWFTDYRFSEDLDFTLTRPITIEEILAGLNEVFADVEAACGLHVAFDREDRHGHQNSHTFYLRYQGPLPAPNDVKVDITISEVLCYPLEDRQILRTYAGFDDLPEGPTLKVYTGDSSIPDDSGVLQFDPEKYRKYLDETGWTKEQKDEWLRVLWDTMSTIVDLGQGIDPRHTAMPSLASPIGQIERRNDELHAGTASSPPPSLGGLDDTGSA